MASRREAARGGRRSGWRERAAPAGERSPVSPVAPAAPAGLRASPFSLGSSRFLVLSFPAERASPIAGLSPTEVEVLHAALGGLSNAEIAAVRNRSVFTIQNQLASAFRKLGVTTRAEAAARLDLERQSEG
jgi:DNA-binding CsgD family transcriptional regulator